MNNNVIEAVPAPAPGRGRGRGRGGAVANAGPARAPVFLNPENPPDLINKFRKELGVNVEEIRVSYTASGTTVLLKIVQALKKAGETGDIWVSPVEFGLRAKAKKADAGASEAELLKTEFDFKSLYLKRLNKDLPTPEPQSWTEAGIKRWIIQQPMEDRKVLTMNAKAFRAHQRQTTGEAEQAED